MSNGENGKRRSWWIDDGVAALPDDTDESSKLAHTCTFVEKCGGGGDRQGRSPYSRRHKLVGANSHLSLSACLNACLCFRTLYTYMITCACKQTGERTFPIARTQMPTPISRTDVNARVSVPPGIQSQIHSHYIRLVPPVRTAGTVSYVLYRNQRHRHARDVILCARM